MKKWKIRSKCLFALLLVVMILGMQLFQGTRVIEVQATTVNADISTEGKVTNGDFESGRVGYSVSGWSKTSMDVNSVKNTEKDWTQNFILKTESDNGSKVASFRKNGTGYAAMTSGQVAVESGKTYELSVDYKMKDFSLDIDPATGKAYTTGVKFRGIRFVIEQFDAQGNTLVYTGYPTSNIVEEESVEWNTYSTEFTTNAQTKSVVVHCWLGGDKYVNSTVLLDNVTIEASSSLYKQSALFVGDAVGGGLAQQASSYSEMQVTNACSDTVTLAEQLKMYAGNTYDYLFVSGGMQEFASNMRAGSVTADTVYMDGMDFDTTTFAGMMEYNFGKIAECYGKQKVVYVLTTDNNEYQTVAQSAANKWNVQLVMLGDVSNAVANWNEVIEPAEVANVFNCYQVSGLLDYLSKKVDEIVGTEISITVDVAALENIKEKAQNCPDTHVDYVGYQALILRIEDTLVKFQDFRPLICGGTISTEDPNVLSFIALSPKNALTEGVKIKSMGILSMPTAYMDQTSSEYKPDAVLELGNTYVKNMEAVYSEASKEFRVYQESWEVDPYTEYTARAYVVYEANEQTLVFYSTNDYINELGIKTATEGRCTKSVFGISKIVALKLASEKIQEMTFASINGEKNVPLIDTATEDTEISLLDVYHLIHENRTLLKEWLDKGGTSE